MARPANVNRIDFSILADMDELRRYVIATATAAQAMRLHCARMSVPLRGRALLPVCERGTGEAIAVSQCDETPDSEMPGVDANDSTLMARSCFSCRTETAPQVGVDHAYVLIPLGVVSGAQIRSSSSGGYRRCEIPSTGFRPLPNRAIASRCWRNSL